MIEIAAGKLHKGGQGFLVSQAVRKAVEVYATDWAARYYRAQGWMVTDVGASEPYDLHCTRGLTELHVEVKGTTTFGETIILTRNEVAHAKKAHPNVELFVVTDIRIDEQDGDDHVASGGVARVCGNWLPTDDRLMPMGYVYSTGLAGPETRAPWKLVLGLGDLESH